MLYRAVCTIHTVSRSADTNSCLGSFSFSSASLCSRSIVLLVALLVSIMPQGWSMLYRLCQIKSNVFVTLRRCFLVTQVESSRIESNPTESSRCCSAFTSPPLNCLIFLPTSFEIMPPKYKFKIRVPPKKVNCARVIALHKKRGSLLKQHVVHQNNFALARKTLLSSTLRLTYYVELRIM